MTDPTLDLRESLHATYTDYAKQAEQRGDYFAAGAWIAAARLALSHPVRSEPPDSVIEKMAELDAYMNQFNRGT